MTISTDDFNRSNSTSLGANWSEFSGNVEIVSNRVQVVSGNEFSENLTKWTSDTGHVDSYAQAAITFNAGGGGYGNAGIIVRANGSNDDHYRCVINQTACTVTWIKISGGGYTNLYTSGSNAITWGSGTTVTWKVTVDGTTNTNLKLYKNGVLQSGVNYTDSSSPITTGQRGGFTMEYVGGVADFYVDSFEQGKLVEGTNLATRLVFGVNYGALSTRIGNLKTRVHYGETSSGTETGSPYVPDVRSLVSRLTYGSIGANTGALTKVGVGSTRLRVGVFGRPLGNVRVAALATRMPYGVGYVSRGFQSRALTTRLTYALNSRLVSQVILSPPAPSQYIEPVVYRTPVPPDDLIVEYFGATARIRRYVDIYEADDKTPFAVGVKCLDADVNIDFDRDERRIFSLVLDNGEGEYAPQPEGVWYDKVFRLYKGFDTDLGSWEKCLGHFLADSIASPHFPPTVTINGRDFTKKLINDEFPAATMFQSGTGVAAVIRTIALNAGIYDFNLDDGGAFLTIDSLHEAGTSRWEGCAKICEGYGLDLFFDSNAVLTMHPYADPVSTPTIFTFVTGPRVGNLVSYDKVVNDSRLKNHVVVVGATTKSGAIPAWGQAENNEPSSPTRIEKVGRRTDKIDSPYVTTDNEAVALAETYLSVAGLESYEVSLGAVQVPWLDVGNVVNFIDPDPYPDQPEQFMLTSIDIPWKLGPMTGQAKRVQLVGTGFTNTKPRVNPRDLDPNNNTPDNPDVDNPPPPPDDPPPPDNPPPPATAVTQLFTGSNGAVWPNGSDGAVWRSQELTTAWALNIPATAGLVDVQSNKGRQRSGANAGPNGYASVLSYPDASYPADGTWTFDFTPQWADRTVENYAAFSFRCTTRNLYDWRFTGCYEVRIYRLSGAAIQLYKFNTDTTEVSLGNTYNSWAAGDTIHGKVTTLGSNIKVRLWKNAETEPTTWTYDVNDSTYAGDTFCVGTGAGAAGTAQSIVDWDNITFSTGGTVSPPPPTGNPGSLVSNVSRGTMTGGHKVYNIVYKMTGIDGSVIDATGIAVVPSGTPPTGGWRTVTVGHGATGASDDAAPSIASTNPDTLAGQITGNVGSVATLCAAGFVVVMSDYEGMGGQTNWRHPYMVGVSAGRSLIDAARAVAGLPGVIVNKKVAAWGFSQGGHAALWAGELVASGAYGTDLNLVAVALDPVIPTQYVHDQYIGSAYYGLLNTYGQWVADGTLNLSQVVDGTASAAMAGSYDYYGAGSLLGDPTLPSAWSAAFRKTDPGYRNGGRVLHFQASSGIYSQDQYVARAPSFGTQLDYRMRTGGHDSTFTASVQAEGLTWVNGKIP